jgi:hypothetical protein
VERVAGTPGRRAAYGPQQVRADTAAAGPPQAARIAVPAPLRTVAQAQTAAPTLARKGTQVRLRIAGRVLPETSAHLTRTGAREPAEPARTGARDPAKTAVRPAPAAGAGVRARASPRTARVRRRHVRLDLVRWPGVPKAGLPAAEVRTARAGTTGRRPNVAARAPDRAARTGRPRVTDRILRAGRPRVKAPAAGEVRPVVKATRRQRTVPAGRVSPVRLEPRALATAAQDHLRHVHPGRARQARARQARARQARARQARAGPGGAMARMPGATRPESAARAPLLTAGQTVRPVAGTATPDSHLAIGHLTTGHLAIGLARTGVTGPGQPPATATETVRRAHPALGAAIARGAATAPGIAIAPGIATARSTATGTGATTATGAAAGNDQAADVPVPAGTTPRPGPRTSADRRSPTRSAPSSSTPRPAPS